MNPQPMGSRLTATAVNKPITIAKGRYCHSVVRLTSTSSSQYFQFPVSPVFIANMSGMSWVALVKSGIFNGGGTVLYLPNTVSGGSDYRYYQGSGQFGHDTYVRNTTFPFNTIINRQYYGMTDTDQYHVSRPCHLVPSRRYVALVVTCRCLEPAWLMDSLRIAEYSHT